MATALPEADTHAGQAVYSPLTLALYDHVVLGFSNRLLWRCPTNRILALYDKHVGAAHLDVGVGTGWFLDHCRFPVAAPRIGLLDLNDSSLEAAARRIARYRPARHRADVLKPIGIDLGRFDSIGLSYLLHCLPGEIATKAAAFDHLLPYLAPGGTMFGATLLSVGVDRSGPARALMAKYNRRGIFSNVRDSAEDLARVLGERFHSVELEVVGCAALFAARDPK